MTSLSDQVDRLSHNTKTIRSVAAQTASFQRKLKTSNFGIAGPFTYAVLNTDLGDLIRDIDPSELGLFTLLTPVGGPPVDNGVRDTRSIEISRAEFSSAAPLRKAPSRRDDAPKANEIEPEIYAQAALKYIDRYQPIQSMPRAYSQITTVLERLSAVRENIQSLNLILERVQATEYSMPQPEDEEKHIQKLNLRMVELKRRKSAVTSQRKNSHQNKSATPKEESTKSGSPASPQEDNFWSTPAAAARTLRFSDNLVDDNLDLNDITTTSFMSPPPTTLSNNLGQELADYAFHQGDTPLRPNLDDNPLLIEDALTTSGNDVIEMDDEIQEQSSTPLVAYNPDGEANGSWSSPSPIPQSRSLLSSNNEPGSLVSAFSQTSRSKHLEIRINSEVERVIEKIWTTAGDLVMPELSFENNEHDEMMPFKVKDTIVHLQLLSASPLIPESPATSIILSAPTIPDRSPTPQQILTAYLLLTLLTSTPRFSMPLNQAKDLLASKAMGSPVSAQGITRIIYGCVAKRLLKIERGGGEQIVRIDF